MARGVLDTLEGLNAKSVKDDLATFEVPNGSTLTRSEIIARCTKSNVCVVSVQRQGATALERQIDLEAELQELRVGDPYEIPDKVLNNERTRTSLQLLGRLRQAIANIHKADTKGAARPKALAAGDARLVDTMRLIDRHIEWIGAHGIRLPEITTDAVIEKFEQRGTIFAISSRFVHSELFDFYRRSFREISHDALVATTATKDAHAKSQYQALHEVSEALVKVVTFKVMLHK